METQRAFQYCPRCGNEGETKKTHLACPSCGLYFYINPKPCTATIFVNSRGEFLLAKRAIDPGKGLWDIPGGFVEENETFEESAVREIEEELGIRIDSTNLSYIGSFTEPYEFQGITYLTLSVGFICRLPNNAQPQPADDIASYKLFNPNNLPVDKVAFKSMRMMFESANKFLEENEI